MAFNAASATQNKSDINIVPLIDVMLVLLIIFMVTAPTLTYELPIDLPQNVPMPPPTHKPLDPVRLTVDASGALYWNDLPMAAGALDTALKVEAMGRSQEQQPLLQIDASPDSRYQRVAEVLASARNAGIAKIAFVDIPPRQ